MIPLAIALAIVYVVITLMKFAWHLIERADSYGAGRRTRAAKDAIRSPLWPFEVWAYLSKSYKSFMEDVRA